MEKFRNLEKDLAIVANPNVDNTEFAEIVTEIYTAIYSMSLNMGVISPYGFGSMKTLCEIAVDVVNDKGKNSESGPTAAAFAIGYLYTENGEFADKVSKAFGAVNTSDFVINDPDIFYKSLRNVFVELKDEYLKWLNTKISFFRNK